MAATPKTPPAQPTKGSDLGTGHLATFALEYEEDRKKLRWAVGIAVVLHVVLFLIHLPEMIQEAQTATSLMLKGRLPLLPARIKRLDNFKRMIKHIIPLGEPE